MGYSSLKEHEERKAEEKRLEKESNELSDAEDDNMKINTPAGSDYGSEIGDIDEEEQQSQQYQIILGFLDMAKKDFFRLEPDEKLQVVTLLINEHLSSDELK